MCVCGVCVCVCRGGGVYEAVSFWYTNISHDIKLFTFYFAFSLQRNMVFEYQLFNDWAVFLISIKTMTIFPRFYGVMVSTRDSNSGNPSSSLGRTSLFTSLYLHYSNSPDHFIASY